MPELTLSEMLVLPLSDAMRARVMRFYALAQRQQNISLCEQIRLSAINDNELAQMIAEHDNADGNSA